MKRKTILLGALGVLVLGTGIILAGYFRDMTVARARLAAGSRTIMTRGGLVEYGERGAGQPVLVIHGAGGGFDQGLMLGEYALGDGMRVIAPSRFGYAGQPVAADSSLEAQADMYAGLLDALGVHEPVAVLAFSAGGLSGLTFAVRHPDRVKALVMVSAVSMVERVSPGADRKAKTVDSAIGGSFVYWAVDKAMRPKLLQMLGIPQKVQAGLSPRAVAAVNRTLVEMNPMGLRLPGIRLDESRSFPFDFPARVKVPTLVIHCEDDGLVPLRHALHTHELIKGSRLVTFSIGGHFLAGRLDEAREAITSFLATIQG